MFEDLAKLGITSMNKMLKKLVPFKRAPNKTTVCHLANSSHNYLRRFFLKSLLKVKFFVILNFTRIFQTAQFIDSRNSEPHYSKLFPSILFNFFIFGTQPIFHFPISFCIENEMKAMHVSFLHLSFWGNSITRTTLGCVILPKVEYYDLPPNCISRKVFFLCS